MWRPSIDNIEQPRNSCESIGLSQKRKIRKEKNLQCDRNLEKAILSCDLGGGGGSMLHLFLFAIRLVVYNHSSKKG